MEPTTVLRPQPVLDPETHRTPLVVENIVIIDPRLRSYVPPASVKIQVSVAVLRDGRPSDGTLLPFPRSRSGILTLLPTFLDLALSRLTRHKTRCEPFDACTISQHCVSICRVPHHNTTAVPDRILDLHRRESTPNPPRAKQTTHQLSQAG